MVFTEGTFGTILLQTYGPFCIIRHYKLNHFVLKIPVKMFLKGQSLPRRSKVYQFGLEWSISSLITLGIRFFAFVIRKTSTYYDACLRRK